MKKTDSLSNDFDASQIIAIGHEYVRMQEEIKELHAEIEKLRQDAVSGLLARQGFDEHLRSAFHHRRHADGDVGVILIDIDCFKDVNDTYGHPCGDQALFEVGRALQRQIRAGDTAARYGGDEFACLIHRASLAGLAIFSERLRQAVQALEHQPECPRVTVSIGFDVQAEDDTEAKQLITRVDQALYRAKREGRNRIAHPTLGSDEIELILEVSRNQRRGPHPINTRS